MEECERLSELILTLQNAYDDLREQNHALKKELQEEVKKNSSAEMFLGMIGALRCVATDPGAAKNYVEVGFQWDEALAPELPFKDVSIVFHRPGAKTPGELVREALKARDAAIGMAAGAVQSPPTDGALTGFLEELERLRQTPDSNPIDLP